ncbi:MAG: VWA domain-containing protein, partial [Bacteroidota bacterium]
MSRDDAEKALDPLVRWRLILGGGEAEGTQQGLTGRLKSMDQALADLYEADPKDRRGLGGSSPKVNRWLGDIREYFPSSVVSVLQKDAMDRLGIQRLLLEPEVLNGVQPDVNLVATLLSLKDVIPDQTKETARQVIARVVEDLQRQMKLPLLQALRGALNRGVRSQRPKFRDINWTKTLTANLQHYQAEYQTIIPQRLIGYGRKKSALKRVILALDQSGSMASSVIYASVFAAVLASMRAIQTQLVAFDTAVVDLSEYLSDPVDVLFGVQLGGGTHIGKALDYCQSLVSQPEETILILISDLYEGGNRERMLARAAELKKSGVNFITLLALTD